MLSRFSIVLFVLLSGTMFGHPGHQDPVYAELNDYLMGIQIMRYNDIAAEKIFDTWVELRNASWQIRALTDEQDLLINSQEVMHQISITKAKQKQLLLECREYFAHLALKEEAIHVQIDQGIEINWNDPLIKVQVQHKKLVIVQLQNDNDLPVTVTLRANQSDEILFWNKRVTLEANTTLFTYLVCSPLNMDSVTNTLHVVDSNNNRAQIDISLLGVPRVDPPYRLIPGATLTKVILPQKEDPQQTRSFDEGQKIRFDVVDYETGKPIAVRLRVTDGDGHAYWHPVDGESLGISRDSGWQTSIWEHQPGPYFYLKGGASLGVSPVGKSVEIRHGFEYLPQSMQVPTNGEVTVLMKRWINMPSLGWFAGHTHIHTTDVGIPVQFNQYWPLVSQAEDLHVSTILSLKGEWMTHAIYANEYPMGERKAFSNEEYIIEYGEEYRSNPYGHLAFIGLDHLIQPISSGALGELGGPDYPSNAQILEQALDQGANTIAAHFGNFIKVSPEIKSPWPSTGFEMPVDIALGKIQLAEIYGNGGQLDVWYDILNCGFRIPATAGPDWVIKDSPRVYVYLDDQQFNFENWRNGLKEGRSFITKGPMLFFEVDNMKAGQEILIGKESNKLQVIANAKVPEGDRAVELVFNGEVIYRGTNINTELTFNDSGWLAARCDGAHSNPIYLEYQGKPAGFSQPSLKFIEIIDRLEKWVSEKALFYNGTQKQKVLSVIEEGRQVYERIAAKAKEYNK